MVGWLIEVIGHQVEAEQAVSMCEQVKFHYIIIITMDNEDLNKNNLFILPKELTQRGAPLMVSYQQVKINRQRNLNISHNTSGALQGWSGNQQQSGGKKKVVGKQNSNQ